MTITALLLLTCLSFLHVTVAFLVVTTTSPTPLSTAWSKSCTQCRFESPLFKSSSSSRLFVDRDNDGNIRKGPIEFLLDPKPTKIPPELKDEIYKAEANTTAARDRQKRVLIYAAIAVVGIGITFLNVLLTELRSPVEDQGALAGGNAVAISFEDIGWGWVESNALFHFLLANKIGGALALIGGAGSAMMIEAEVDAQRANAEKIWEELERRRNNKENPPAKKKKLPSLQSPRKKQPSGTQKKRLAALSEVVLDSTDDVTTIISAEAKTEHDNNPIDGATVTKEEGILDKLKGWYEQADSMAAAQALLLNKELEDKGVLEKITDESGLRVIGKDAAAKLKQYESSTSKGSE